MMSDKDMDEFKKEQEVATEALKVMMHKGDAVTWPEARPFYMQRFNGWMKDGKPHDLIKMLGRLQGQLEAARDHYAPELTEQQAAEICERVAAEKNNPCVYEAMMEALRAAGIQFREEA